jgi:hypothetical protein
MSPAHLSQKNSKLLHEKCSTALDWIYYMVLRSCECPLHILVGQIVLLELVKARKGQCIGTASQLHHGAFSEQSKYTHSIA